MTKPTTKTELQKRFSNVLKLLKDKGVTQRKILDQLKLDPIYDETYFSHIKSGKRKNIPDVLINALHEKFNVNPAYLRLESTCPFDTIEIIYECFEKIVNGWDILERDNDKYLHLTMDKNFYDFLIELHRVKEVTEEGIGSFEQEKNSLKEIYSGESAQEEFVLIPRNIFYEIVSNDVEKAKYLNDVLDFSKF